MTAAERRKVAQELLLARFTLKAGLRHVTMDAFRNVFELAPDLPGVRLDFGQLMVLTSKGHDEAVKVLRRGVELYPENPEMWHWYAHSIWQDTATAEALLREILPYRRQDADVLYDIACTRSLAGDLNASADFLRRSIEAGFTTWGLMEADTDLRALRESGKFAEVLREYRR